MVATQSLVKTGRRGLLTLLLLLGSATSAHSADLIYMKQNHGKPGRSFETIQEDPDWAKTARSQYYLMRLLLAHPDALVFAEGYSIEAVPRTRESEIGQGIRRRFGALPDSYEALTLEQKKMLAAYGAPLLAAERIDLKGLAPEAELDALFDKASDTLDHASLLWHRITVRHDLLCPLSPGAYSMDDPIPFLNRNFPSLLAPLLRDREAQATRALENAAQAHPGRDIILIFGATHEFADDVAQSKALKGRRYFEYDTTSPLLR